jgi:uncharacterized protein involved in outer membrane biogenesis
MKASRIVFMIIIALIVLLFLGWMRLPEMVANNLSKKMQVEVEIDDLIIRPSHIDVEKLEIGNVPKYKLPRSFSADHIHVQAPLLSYFDQNVVIDEITISNIYLGLEFAKKGSKEGNWTIIMGNYEKTTASDSAPKDKKTEKSVLIKKLILNNIAIDLAYNKEGTVQHLKPIPRLEFTNVTSEGGIPTDQITKVIMQQMLQSVFSQENLQNMIEGFLQSPQQGVESIFDSFKGLIP